MRISDWSSDVCSSDRIGEQPRYQAFVGGDRLAVLAASRRARIPPGEEAGAARRTNRALAEGALEQHTLFREAIEMGRLDMIVAVAAERIPSLLIGADPQDIDRKNTRLNSSH